MARSLIPFFFRDFPALEEENWEISPFTGKAGDVTISEDEAHVYVEAPIPGVRPEDAEVTYDRGVLCVRGRKEEKEEDKKRKFYRKSTSSFSYCVHVPGDIDEEAQVEARVDHGVMKVAFVKRKEKQPKKIEVKKGG